MKRTILTILLTSVIWSSCFILPKPAQRGILRPVKAYPVERQKGNRIMSIAVVSFWAGFIYLYGIRK
jgi:hypothetical protein